MDESPAVVKDVLRAVDLGAKTAGDLANRKAAHLARQTADATGEQTAAERDWLGGSMAAMTVEKTVVWTAVSLAVWRDSSDDSTVALTAATMAAQSAE